MKCCPECFGDRGLTKNIIPNFSTELGQCSYCQTADIALVEPIALQDSFEALIHIYEADADGRPLVAWLKEDWRLFDHLTMDESRAKDLLAAILDNGEIVRETFSPSARFQSDRLLRWEELRNELKHKNRYFPEATLDFERFETLLAYLPAEELTTTWFRARIQDGDTIYPMEEMGAPPERRASHGRANPPGIPYLYLGSTPHTAISEIRPHTGERASVAEFRVPDDLKVVDLREPRKLVSPFLLGGEDDIGSMRVDIGFLERLGEELTRPVLPSGAAIDYVPSQYLCEFIKKCGYDGVLYSSSVSEGVNLALFDPQKAAVSAVRQMQVSQVVVTVQEA
ncbi:MAG: RES domain-containing protein [Caulobacter sp.]|nr:RES domain-containing protein [Caulobacter sp.]